MKKVKIAKKNGYNDYNDDEDSLDIVIHIKNWKFCLFIILSILLFSGFYFLFPYFKKSKYQNYINVSYAFDGNYHYITHVSMKSIMLSQDKTTFINFYMLVSNINDEQREVINRIGIEHENCKIIYIDMGDQFKELHIPKDPMAVWSTANFYRVKLQDLLPNEHKIIYLDTDTLILCRYA